MTGSGAWLELNRPIFHFRDTRQDGNELCLGLHQHWDCNIGDTWSEIQLVVVKCFRRQNLEYKLVLGLHFDNQRIFQIQTQLFQDRVQYSQFFR